MSTISNAALIMLASRLLHNHGCGNCGFTDGPPATTVPLGSMYNDYSHLAVDEPGADIGDPGTFTTHADFVDNEIVFFNGLTHYDSGVLGRRMTVPWSEFLTDGSYATMRVRLAGSPWLAFIDDLRTDIDSIRGDNDVVLYGQFIHYEGDTDAYNNALPLPNVDATTWPAEFYVDGVLSFGNPEVVAAYGRLSAFLVEHYDVDHFLPWREMNLIVGSRRADFLAAYTQIVKDVYAVSPATTVSVSWLVQLAYVETFNDGDLNDGTLITDWGENIALFWNANKGYSPTLISYSTYPSNEETTTSLIDGSGVSDIARPINDAARFIASEDLAAFASTPIAIAECGMGGWITTDESVYDYMQTDRYSSVQMIFIAGLLNYRYHHTDEHPVAFVNNWMVRDSAFDAETGALTSGLRDANNNPRAALSVKLEEE